MPRVRGSLLQLGFGRRSDRRAAGLRGHVAAYVSRRGHAFIDRALYLPKGWTDDPARLKTTYVEGSASRRHGARGPSNVGP
jgi:hypothetical protein